MAAAPEWKVGATAMEPAWVKPLRVARLDVRFFHALAWDVVPAQATNQRVPDLAHWPTRMQCLAELAKRVGLDPEGGVIWRAVTVVGVTGFVLTVAQPMPDFGYACPEVTDPLLGLALALKDTAPREGAS